MGRALSVQTASLPCDTRAFPGLGVGLLGRRTIYLNNACLTPTPQDVVNAVAEYYSMPPGCPLRAKSSRSADLEDRFRDARTVVQEWIGAKFSSEIVFTPNTTGAINLLAGAFSQKSGAVLLTDAEHNSNRLPWLSQDIVELPWPPGAAFPMDRYGELLRQDIKLVSVASVSNTTGARIPLRQVISAADEHGIPVHVDAAQQSTDATIDVAEDRPEFLSLSLHKAYGPSGIGVLYIRRELHDTLRPALAGGGSVDDHHNRDFTMTAAPARFEYGLQNYASQYAVPAGIDFLRRFPASEIAEHFRRLNELARGLLGEIEGVHFIGPEDPADCGSICNFYIEGVDSLRLAELLDLVGNIHVRAGQFCAHHYYHQYGLPASVRLSFGFHNTEKEVARCVEVVRSILQRYL